jgi:aryl-alcohol dehydrogenase-like predicted oxidoreductase
METREFGDTDIQVSEIGLGCGGLGAGRKKDLEHVLEYAFDHGVTFYDTADMYAGGASEETLGKVFEKKRDRIVLCTKFGTVIDPDGKSSHKNVSLEHMREALEGSRKRLRTDYFDVYLFHNPPMSVLEDRQLFDALDALVDEGKIRCYGTSIDNGPDATRFLDETGSKAIQMILSLFQQGARDPFLKDANEKGAGVIIKVPLAGGTLSGRFTPDSPSPDDGRRRRWGEDDFKRRLDLVEKARPILEKPGRTMAQGALAWLLSLEGVTVLIPGVTSLEKVKENIGAGGMRLTPDEMQALDNLGGGEIRNADLRW